MATLQQVRDKANAKLATLWPVLQAKQDAYFMKHGKYFQLLAGSDLTLDGADTPFMVVTPSDEIHIIDIDIAWSETVPFKIEVKEWVGKENVGYLARVTVNHQGTLYRRERDSNNNDTNWYPYIS